MPPEQNNSPASGPGGTGRPGGASNMPSWLVWVLVGVVLVVFVAAISLSSEKSDPIAYTAFTEQIADGKVESVTWNNVDANISGELKSGEAFTTTGPTEPPPELLTLMR